MVLIVEDEVIARRALRQLLRLQGYEAETASSAEEAIRLIAAEGLPELALVDINLPGMSGVEFVHRLHRADPTVPCVFMTASDESNYQQARSTDPEPTLRKPLDASYLLRLVDETPNVRPEDATRWQ